VHDDDAGGPVVESAIVWFNGVDADSGFFASAVDDGAFLLGDGFAGAAVYGEPRAWPAAVERPEKIGGRGFRQSGRRLGIDVVRGCLVVEITSLERVVINLGAGNAVVELGRKALAEGQIDR